MNTIFLVLQVSQALVLGGQDTLNAPISIGQELSKTTIQKMVKENLPEIKPFSLDFSRSVDTSA